MQLQLVSHALCPFVHRATALLHHKGVAFETRYVDLKAKPDWFLAISPRGRVPVLVADGEPLFESTAILEFLDETQPPALLPANAFERARQRAWFEVASDLFAANYKLTTAADAAQVAAAVIGVDTLLTRFEQNLRGKYFAGDALSLVDFAVAPVVYRLRLLEGWTSLRLTRDRPIEAYATALSSLSSVIAGVPADFAEVYRAYTLEKGALLAA